MQEATCRFPDVSFSLFRFRPLTFWYFHQPFPLTNPHQFNPKDELQKDNSLLFLETLHLQLQAPMGCWSLNLIMILLAVKTREQLYFACTFLTNNLSPQINLLASNSHQFLPLHTTTQMVTIVAEVHQKITFPQTQTLSLVSFVGHPAPSITSVDHVAEHTALTTVLERRNQSNLQLEGPDVVVKNRLCSPTSSAQDSLAAHPDNPRTQTKHTCRSSIYVLPRPQWLERCQSFNLPK